MKRKLRIAFSAVCGILCLLLIALWLQSYLSPRQVQFVGAQNQSFYVTSNRGVLGIGGSDDPYAFFGRKGWFSHIPSEPTLKSAFFDVKFYASSTVVYLYQPYWVPVLVAATVAAIPLVKWRFSLRTALIATTLVAVVLGAIVCSIK